MRYQGNYSYYMEKKLIQQKEKMQQEPPRRKNTSSDQQFRLQQKEREKNRRQLMRAIADREERITALEEEKQNLEILLSELATYQDDKLSRELPQEYQEVLQRLEESLVEWEELNHMLAESGEEGSIN